MLEHKATFGGGCFWCTEAVFEVLNGVTGVVPGYAGGHVVNPTYEEVCGKRTGHAEVIQFTYDPAAVTYKQLVELFLVTHDPTSRDKQGNDVGPQYRSVIYAHDEEQSREAAEVIAALDTSKIFAKPIVTEVEPLKNFSVAEAYHHGYFRAHPEQPYCAYLIGPKLGQVRKKFAALLKA